MKFEYLGIDLGKSGTINMREYGNYYSFKEGEDNNLRVGDILWVGRYKDNKTWSGHVGIYVGNGKVVEEVGSPINNVVESEFKKENWMGYITFR